MGLYLRGCIYEDGEGGVIFRMLIGLHISRRIFGGLINGILRYKRNIRLESSISRNIRKFRYARVQNILFLKYKKSSIRKVPICQGSDYTFPEL